MSAILYVLTPGIWHTLLNGVGTPMREVRELCLVALLLLLVDGNDFKSVHRAAPTHLATRYFSHFAAHMVNLPAAIA